MNNEKNIQKPTLLTLEKNEKDQRKSIFLRLEDRAIKMLWSFVERDASSWRFWVKIIVVMLLVNTALPIAGYLFFLGRDLGYFE